MGHAAGGPAAERICQMPDPLLGIERPPGGVGLIHRHEQALEPGIGKFQQEAGKAHGPALGVQSAGGLHHHPALLAAQVGRPNLPHHQSHSFGHPDEDLEHLTVPGGQSGRPAGFVGLGRRSTGQPPAAAISLPSIVVSPIKLRQSRMGRC